MIKIDAKRQYDEMKGVSEKKSCDSNGASTRLE
jgi:hypothetical protein